MINIQASHSRINCFEHCPYQYKLRYIDKLKVIEAYEANNALVIGNTLHQALETILGDAIKFYYSKFPIITDRHIEELIKLEILVPKVKLIIEDLNIYAKEFLISTKEFKGIVDLIVKNEDGTVDIFDYKYSNNVNNYLDSEQLHLYKYYFEKVTGLKVRRLGFIFVPKFNGRMKNDEDLYMFRKRLIKEVDKLEIKLVEIKYDPNKIISFQRKIIKVLETNTYEKNVTRLCDWCDYKNYCIKGVDYMILPKNERRERKIDTNPDLWIYADSYVGKSTFIDQFNDLLFLNTDGNTDNTTSPVIRIADEVKVEGRITKRKFAWDVFLETISELEKKQNDFKRVCIDLVEDVYEHCRLYTYDKLGIQHEQDAGFGKGWDMVRTEYLSAIKRLKNLGYQIIYISKETISEINLKNGAKLTTIKPNINDKVANILAGTVDLTVRAYVKDEERFLQLEKKENIFGGGRFDFKVNEIPLNKEEFIKALEEAQEGIKTYSKVESSVEVKEEPKKNKKGKVVEESEKIEDKESEEVVVTEEEQPKKSRKRKKKSDPVEDLMLHEIEGI